MALPVVVLASSKGLALGCRDAFSRFRADPSDYQPSLSFAQPRCGALKGPDDRRNCSLYSTSFFASDSFNFVAAKVDVRLFDGADQCSDLSCEMQLQGAAV